MATQLAANGGIGDAPPQEAAVDRWGTVSAITLGAFVMVTSEFLPIGLLSAISAGLQVPLGTASWLVTVPGIVAAFAAPALTVLARDVDRRKLLVGLSALVALSNLVAAISASLWVILVARLLLGIAVGGFWTFSSSVGRRLVSERSGHRATALIMGGISAGTVLGVPAGAWLGEVLGWRSAFGSLALLAGAALVVQMLLLPSLRPAVVAARSSLGSAMKVRVLRVGLGAAALMVVGHFAGFTYLEPLLSSGAKFTAPAAQGTLLLYGLAGLIGTVLAERAASRRVRPAFAGAAAAASVSLLLLGLFARQAQASSIPLAAWPVAVALWGAAFGALPVCLQVWMFKAAPQKLEAASALSVVVFQVALASGAFLGGRAMALGGLPASFTVAGSLALLAAVALLLAREPADH